MSSSSSKNRMIRVVSDDLRRPDKLLLSCQCLPGACASAQATPGANAPYTQCRVGDDGCLLGPLPAGLAHLLWILPNVSRAQTPRRAHPSPSTDGPAASAAYWSQLLPGVTSPRAISVSGAGAGWVSDRPVGHVWPLGSSSGPAHRLLRFRWPSSSCACFTCLSLWNRRGLSFLYRIVLNQDLGPLAGWVRAKLPRRLPMVLTPAQVG